MPYYLECMKCDWTTRAHPNQLKGKLETPVNDNPAYLYCPKCENDTFYVCHEI